MLGARALQREQQPEASHLLCLPGTAEGPGGWGRGGQWWWQEMTGEDGESVGGGGDNDLVLSVMKS